MFFIRAYRAPSSLLLVAALAVPACSSSSAPTTPEHDASTDDAKPAPSPDASHKDAEHAATKRVFVTSGKFTGDLATQGKAADGLSGGDAICNTAAQAAHLTGTWVAWLSTAKANATSRVDMTAIRVLVDGTTKVFDPAGSNGLVSLSPLTMDETGAALPTSGDGDGFEVWTGTDGFGHYETGDASGAPNNPVDDACKQWTSASSSLAATEGSLGAVASSVVPDSNWTDGSPAGFDTCDSGQRLYCFEK